MAARETKEPKSAPAASSKVNKRKGESKHDDYAEAEAKVETKRDGADTKTEVKGLDDDVQDEILKL